MNEREFQSMKSVGYDHSSGTPVSLSFNRYRYALFAHSVKVFRMTFSFSNGTVMHSPYTEVHVY